MTYTRSTPNTGESLNFTRPIINTNFDQIYLQFAKNHAAFNTADSGKHTLIQMVLQASAPTTAANETAMYNKAGLYAPNEPSVFARGESDGFEYQITNPDQARSANFGTLLTPGAPFGAFTLYGWIFLPGGLIMNYGRRSGIDAAQTTITYAKPYTSRTIFCTAENTAVTSTTIPKVTVTGEGLTGFTLSNTGVLSFVNWISIGF